MLQRAANLMFPQVGQEASEASFAGVFNYKALRAAGIKAHLLVPGQLFPRALSLWGVLPGSEQKPHVKKQKQRVGEVRSRRKKRHKRGTKSSQN